MGMKSIIIGTAGHIDHGKTALVKALTGIDADRLQEEKRRGITIDLGFAHMELSADNGQTIRAGFVDVPGHERFVRNMLAGAGGFDLVLLVIAADEGIMPQTREHFEIMQLLGVQRGLAVLTKSDAVDAETLEVVGAEVQEFLRGTFLDGADSIVPVSALTGAGIDDLKRKLAVLASGAQVRNSDAIARLPIDRVFSMKGFGTVVTGTLISGTIRREEELEAFPTRKRVRVRGVQVHGQSAERATAGQRTALNLAGAAREDLSRGMVLAPPGMFEASARVDARIRLLPSAARALRNRARVHFHVHTMETTAEIVVPPGKEQVPEASRSTGQISPGSERFVRLKLPEPVLLLPGDRFIIRQLSPLETIGGGIVLDAAPMGQMPGPESFLQILNSGNLQKILEARIARRGHDGISFSHLTAETGWSRNAVEIQAAEAARQNRVLRTGDRIIDATSMSALQEVVIRTIENFQKSNPLTGGIPKEELREQVRAIPDVFEAALNPLIQTKKIEIAGELVRLPGRGVALKDEEAESKARIDQAFAAAGLRVPALNDVIGGLKIDRARAQKIVTLLLREKALIKISDDLVFHRSALEDLRHKISGYKTKSAKIDVAQFKSLTGVSRKYAIPLLEYLDRERVTRRVGDGREIL